LTPEELREELGSGRLRGAYLLLGEEALLRDDALRALREAALGDAPSDFDRDTLDGERATSGDLEDALRTLPVVARRRFVVLREPEAERGAKLAEALREWPPALPDDGDAVLVVVSARADRRSGWVRAFGDAVVACDPPRGARAVAAFARSEAARQGVSLGSGVAELLAERIGPQLLLLRREIEKLALVAGPGARVTRDHARAAALDLAEEPIWDLTDAIGEGRSGRALGVLARLLHAGQPPPVVLGALASHFRRLLRVRAGSDVPGPPFVRRKLQSQARRYTPQRLLVCLRAIHDTDVILKGQGALDPELALERLVLGLSA